jgi:hypothetical protein
MAGLTGEKLQCGSLLREINGTCISWDLLHEQLKSMGRPTISDDQGVKRHIRLRSQLSSRRICAAYCECKDDCIEQKKGAPGPGQI